MVGKNCMTKDWLHWHSSCSLRDETAWKLCFSTATEIISLQNRGKDLLPIFQSRSYFLEFINNIAEIKYKNIRLPDYKWVDELYRTFKNYIKIANIYFLKCSSSLTISKIQIKIVWKHLRTIVRIDIIKK